MDGPSENILLRLKRTGLIKDQKSRQLLRLLDAIPDDAELQSLVSETLESAEMRDKIDPDPFRATNPMSEELPAGDLILGGVYHTGAPWLINHNALTSSILICGRSGGGKTNLILLILMQILGLNR